MAVFITTAIRSSLSLDYEGPESDDTEDDQVDIWLFPYEIGDCHGEAMLESCDDAEAVSNSPSISSHRMFSRASAVV